MKRQIMICALLTSFSLLPLILRAQETPAAAAEREEAEGRYKRMSTEIEGLQEANQSYAKRLSEMREEIRKLNEEIVRLGSNKDAATREDFKLLADKIREVDEKRIAENEKLWEKVAAEFSRLGKSLAAPPKSNSPTSPPKGAAPPTTPLKAAPEPKLVSDKGYEYTIRSGDNPRVIALALTKEKGVKVTSQQIIDANPNVVWTKLRIGQKIFIPAPAAQ